MRASPAGFGASEETPQRSWTPGFGREVRAVVLLGSEGDSRPVAVEAMRRGVAGAHPVLSLRSEPRLGLHPLRPRH